MCLKQPKHLIQQDNLVHTQSARVALGAPLQISEGRIQTTARKLASSRTAAVLFVCVRMLISLYEKKKIRKKRKVW